MIKVENLSKIYGETIAVENLTFKAKENEILGFLGPNGAGKTTTMRIITGFMPPTSGNVYINQFHVIDDSSKAKKIIGYLPENPPLYHDMNVISYLDFMAKIKGVHNKKIRKERISKAIESYNLTNVTKKLCGNLSKGYKQRVGLAQATIHNPEVVILDEPTSGLDPVQIIEVRNLINKMRENHTVILSTHILPEVSVTCDRVLIINKGKLVAEDTPENLKSRLLGNVIITIKCLKFNDEVKDKILNIKTVNKIIDKTNNKFDIHIKENSDPRPEIAQILVENDLGLLELYKSSISLEDVYLKLITKEKGVD